jgi:hypothetical protein
MTDRAELVARIFFDTMYPSQNWDALPKTGNTRTVLMHAANKALAALMPPLMKLDDATGAVTLFEDQPTSDWPVNYKEQFWAKYPHKIGKGGALKVLERLRGKLGRPAWADLMAGVDRYMATKPVDRPWCNPSTFLTQERWADQPADIAHGGMNGASRNGSQAGFGQGGGQGGLASYALSRARDSGPEGF